MKQIPLAMPRRAFYASWMLAPETVHSLWTGIGVNGDCRCRLSLWGHKSRRYRHVKRCHMSSGGRCQVISNPNDWVRGNVRPGNWFLHQLQK